MFYSKASIRHDQTTIRQFAISGLLDGTVESDHRLVWSLFPDDQDTKRDFLFKVTGRSAFCVEVLSARPPSGHADLWTVQSREVDLVSLSPKGSVQDLSVTAVLLKSERPIPLEKRAHRGERARKHDLVSALHHGLKSGNPAPEVAHLPPDASRADIAHFGSLNWFWRASQRLGFEFVSRDDGNPFFAVESGNAPASAKTNGKPFRFLDVKARVRVTNPNAYATMLREGIGSGKSYGFGLVRSKIVC